MIALAKNLKEAKRYILASIDEEGDKTGAKQMALSEINAMLRKLGIA